MGAWRGGVGIDAVEHLDFADSPRLFSSGRDRVDDNSLGQEIVERVVVGVVGKKDLDRIRV